MGIHLAAEGMFEGVYTLLVLAYYLYFLGYFFWRLWKWKWDTKIFTLFATASFLVILYTGLAVAFQKYFSYSGSTAVFFTLTAVCASTVIHYIDVARNKIYFVDLVQIITSNQIDQTSFHDVLRSTRQKSKHLIKIKILIISVLYIFLSVGYCLLVTFRGNSEYRGLPWISTSIVFVTDLCVIPSMETIKKDMRHPLIASCVILIPRLCCVFLPSYWVLTHYSAISLIMVVLFAVLIFQFVDANKVLGEREEFCAVVEKVRKYPELQELIKKYNEEMRDLDKKRREENLNGDQFEYKDFELPEEELMESIRDKQQRNRCIFLIIFGVYSIFVAAYSTLTFWASHYKYAEVDKLYFESATLTQRRMFGLYAIAVCICWFCSLWIKLLKTYIEAKSIKGFQKDNSKKISESLIPRSILDEKCFFLFMTCGILIVNFILIVIVIYCFTAIDEIDTEAKVYLISLAILVPILFMSGAVFYFYFSFNNFHFYKRNRNRHLEKRIKDKQKRRKHRARATEMLSNEEFSPEQEGGDLSSQADSPQSDETNHENEENPENAPEQAESVETEQTSKNSWMPACLDDWITVLSLSINIFSLVVAFIINLQVYYPQRVSVILFCWIMMIEFAAFAYLNLYHSNYNWRNKWFVFSLIVILLCYANSLGFGLFMVHKESDGEYREASYVAVGVSHGVLFPLAFIYFYNYTPWKHVYNVEKQGMNPRWIMIFLFCIFLIAGSVLLMSLWQMYASGTGCIILAVYIIIYYAIFDQFWFRVKFSSEITRRVIMAMILIPILITAIVLLLIFVSERAEAMLEIFSLIIYSLIAFLFKRFAEQFITNKRKENDQSLTVSEKIIPMFFLKSNSDGTNCDLHERNAEVNYFLIASSFFMFWTLLASLFLEEEHKYIGFSLFALNLLVFFIYIQNKVHKGRSLKVDPLYFASVHQLQQCVLKAKEFVHYQDLDNFDKEITTDDFTAHIYWEKFYVLCDNYFYTDFNKLNPEHPIKQEFFAVCNKFNDRKMNSYQHNFFTEASLSKKLTMVNDIARLRDRAFRDHLSFNAYLKGLITMKTEAFMQQWMDVFKEILAKVNATLHEKEVEFKPIFIHRILKMQSMDDLPEVKKYIELTGEERRKKINNFILKHFKRKFEAIRAKNRERMQTEESKREEAKNLDEEEKESRLEGNKRDHEHAEEGKEQEVGDKRPNPMGGLFSAMKRSKSQVISKKEIIRAIRDTVYNVLDENMQNANQAQKTRNLQRIFDENGDFNPEVSFDDVLNSPGVIKGFKEDKCLSWNSLRQQYQTKNLSFKNIENLKDSLGKYYQTPQLFVDGTKPEDITQGALNDCFFLSGLASIAHFDEEAIKKCFHPGCIEDGQKIGEDEVGREGRVNRYIVRLFVKEQPVAVVVDALFPFNKYNQPLFCKPVQIQTEGRTTTTVEIWTLILEKAFAQLHGSYECLDFGIPSQAVLYLIKGVPLSIPLQPEPNEILDDRQAWNKLLKCSSQNNFMSVCSLNEDKLVLNFKPVKKADEDGAAGNSENERESEKEYKSIVPKHAYTVLDVLFIDNEHKLVQLRNPHGDYEWCGRFSDYDRENLTYKLVKQIEEIQRKNSRITKLAGQSTNDGIFWMCFDDFKKCFSKVSAVRLFKHSQNKYSMEHELFEFDQEKKEMLKYGKMLKIVSKGRVSFEEDNEFSYSDATLRFQQFDPLPLPNLTRLCAEICIFKNEKDSLEDFEPETHKPIVKTAYQFFDVSKLNSGKPPNLCDITLTFEGWRGEDYLFTFTMYIFESNQLKARRSLANPQGAPRQAHSLHQRQLSDLNNAQIQATPRYSPDENSSHDSGNSGEEAIAPQNQSSIEGSESSSAAFEPDPYSSSDLSGMYDSGNASQPGNENVPTSRSIAPREVPSLTIQGSSQSTNFQNTEEYLKMKVSLYSDLQGEVSDIQSSTIDL